MALRPPNTNAVVSYAYTLMANGIPIGTLQRLSKSQERGHQVVKEVKRSPRDVKEILLDRATYTLEAERVRTYTKNVFQAFGFVYSDIGLITTPIQIIESITLPEGFDPNTSGVDILTEGINAIQTGIDIVNVYTDCWPIRQSETVVVNQTLVTESVSFACTGIIPMDLSTATNVLGNLIQGIF